MGNCVGGDSSDGNVFKVRNVNDNKYLVQRGLMRVTSTELVYIDSTTRDEWHWPHKYVRNYGWNGDIFTFEAGRKCADGEGFYAFSTNKASFIYKRMLIASNINQGENQSAAKAPPISDFQAPDTSTLSFPQKQTISFPTRTDQPSHLNLDQGNPLLNSDLSSSSNPDIVTSDMEKEKSLHRDFVKDVLPISSQSGWTRSNSRSSASGHQHHQKHHHSSGGHSGGGGGGRSLNHTYSENGRKHQVSRSESRFSSQNALMESSRYVRDPCKANGGLTKRGSTTPDLNSSMYQNDQVGRGCLQKRQQQYQNMIIGASGVW